MSKTILLLILILSSTCSFSQKSDTVVNSDHNISSTDRIIYTTVDSVATFRGGLPGWYKYLGKNLNPIVGAENGAKEGTYML